MNGEKASHNDVGGKSRDKPRRRASVRRRVLSHMAKLLATGAAAGTACGVGGCDPAPPPVVAECGTADLPQYVSAWADWDQELEAYVVNASVSPLADNLAIAGQPTIEGAELRDLDLSQTYLDLELIPLAGSTTIRVVVPIGCDQTQQDVAFVVDISGTPTNGGYIPVRRE